MDRPSERSGTRRSRIGRSAAARARFCAHDNSGGRTHERQRSDSRTPRSHLDLGLGATPREPSLTHHSSPRDLRRYADGEKPAARRPKRASGARGGVQKGWSHAAPGASGAPNIGATEVETAIASSPSVHAAEAGRVHSKGARRRTPRLAPFQKASAGAPPVSARRAVRPPGVRTRAVQVAVPTKPPRPRTSSGARGAGPAGRGRRSRN